VGEDGSKAVVFVEAGEGARCELWNMLVLVSAMSVSDAYLQCLIQLLCELSDDQAHLEPFLLLTVL
jgi:hypothetical protein